MSSEEKIQIINIGKGIEKFLITDFIPHFPTIHGSESIFKIKYSNLRNLSLMDIEYFIRGLHLIEVKYKAQTSNEFGFGSPTPTFKILKKLVLKDNDLALKLEVWISLNNGNYYIPKTTSDNKFKSKLA